MVSSQRDLYEIKSDYMYPSNERSKEESLTKTL